MAATYLQDLQFGVCKSNILCFGKATEATRKALLLDENNPDAHLLAGWLFVMQKDHDSAIASLKRSISINPNNADAYDMLGFTFAMSDQPSECINYARKAQLLNPFPPSWYYQHLGICQREIEEYDSAITAFKKCIQNQPDSMWVLVDLAVTYVLSGQNDKAHKLGIEILKTNPNFSINKFVEVAPFKTQDQTARYRQALRKAGLPD